MKKINEFLQTILIITLIAFPLYNAYISLKNTHEEKEWLVVNKKVIETANKCYLERKCTTNTVTVEYLINSDYLVNVVNPITKEVINPSSYVNLDTQEFIIVS